MDTDEKQPVVPDLATLPPGARIEVKPNGIIVRAANGHFLPGTTARRNEFSQADAGKIASSRWQRHHERVAQAAIDAAIETGHAPADAMAVDFAYPIAKSQAKLALEAGRDSTRAAEFVFTHAGYGTGGDQRDAAGGVRLELWGDALERVLALLGERGEQE